MAVRDERCSIRRVKTPDLFGDAGGIATASYTVDHVPDCECPTQRLLREVAADLTQEP